MKTLALALFLVLSAVSTAFAATPITAQFPARFYPDGDLTFRGKPVPILEVKIGKDIMSFVGEENIHDFLESNKLGFSSMRRASFQSIPPPAPSPLVFSSSIRSVTPPPQILTETYRSIKLVQSPKEPVPRALLSLSRTF